MQKENRKRLLLIIIFVVTIALIAVPTLANITDRGETVKISKDETVYVNLNGNGSVSEINVVHSFPTASGQIIDYGEYEKITNLTNNVNPEIIGEKIIFETANRTPFFYQGKLKQKELPWIFQFTYEIDGKPVDYSKLSGARGHLKMTLNVQTNEKAASLFHKHYMLQVAVPLQLSEATNIIAPEATKVIVGQLATLSFTLLPGESKTFTIEADVTDFKMHAINITAVKSMLPLGKIDDITSGFDEITNGFDELISGTTRLKNGMVDLNNGVGTLHNGVNELASGQSKLLAGMEEYRNGLGAYFNSVPSLRAGSAEIKNGLTAVSGNSEQLLRGYQEIEGGLAAILQNKDQLTMLSGTLLQSLDPNARVLAEAMLQQLGGLEQIHGGISEANTGLAAYTAGVSSIAEQYAAFDTGIGSLNTASEELSQGLESIYQGVSATQNGMSELQKGTGKLKSKTSSLPANIQKIVSGQKEMKKGILDAKSTIEELTGTSESGEIVSFAAPGFVVPDSVQFILRTPGLNNVEDQPVVQDIPEQKSAWQRFLDLFSRS
jgi:X-X-X-Leu-X-X-Gly heptad repeat protein